MRAAGWSECAMTPEERTKVIHWLKESRREFLSVIDGVNERQWTWRPAPGRWPAGEVAEHIVLAEARLFRQVQKAISSPINPDWEKSVGKTARLEAVLAPRLGQAMAPEAILPKGQMTAAQVRERFEKQRVEIVRFAAETEVALKQFIVENAFFGPLNGYQWLIYAPLHTMRHVKQILEVKSWAGYPE